MGSMIVHGVPGSPYVRAALLALEEKRAEYELAAMAPGTLKQQPHLSRHPFGRIPAFEHDGWMLYETRAIMRYVDAVVPGPQLQPEEPRAAARMDQLMNIADWYLMPQVSATITFNRVVAPRFNRPVDEEKIVQSIPNARTCIGEISRLLDGHTWMTGDEISLADLLLAAHLSMLRKLRRARRYCRNTRTSADGSHVSRRVRACRRQPGTSCSNGWPRLEAQDRARRSEAWRRSPRCWPLAGRLQRKSSSSRQIRSGMEQWAPRVDRVLGEQLQRLKSIVEDESRAIAALISGRLLPPSSPRCGMARRSVRPSAAEAATRRVARRRTAGSAAIAGPSLRPSQ